MAANDLTAGDILSSIKAKMGSKRSSAAKLLQSFVANPSLYNQMVAGSVQQVSPYAQFNPDYEYDPASNINSVMMRYSTMPAQYQPLIQAWFGTVKKYGGNNADITNARSQLINDTSFGLDRNSQYQLLDQMYKDSKKFVSAETSREKSQYKAYQSARQKLGVVSGDPMKATTEYISNVLGIKGLPENIPNSLEELTRQKTEEYRQSLVSKGNSEKRASELANMFSAQFLAKAQAKKVNPALMSLAPAIKRLLMGG